MKDTQNVHILYKKLGETPLQSIEHFKASHPEYENIPMTYAGRLDPLAEGLLLVLSGEEVNNKEEYLKLPKTYEFEILWGFRTDTLDLLGLVEKALGQVPKESELASYIQKSIGLLTQQYPAFSSRPVSGKPMFEWAREGRMDEIEVPSHTVEIFSSQFVSRRVISAEDLSKEIIKKINSVKGDFRQDDILKRWEAALEGSRVDGFAIDTLRTSVSSGFYVRQYVSDMAHALGGDAVTFHIKRTKVGNFEL